MKHGIKPLVAGEVVTAKMFNTQIRDTEIALRSEPSNAPLKPCECGCGKSVPGGLMELAHPEDYRWERD